VTEPKAEQETDAPRPSAAREDAVPDASMPHASDAAEGVGSVASEVASEAASETTTSAPAGASATSPTGSPSPSKLASEPPASDAYHVTLPTFEGPLDLLLHLIQQHELDILDIPVSFITEKYLAYIEMMSVMSIDVASEYLVMAATLTHIKSKMLLPSTPGDADEDGIAEEEEDPRAELVRRLLEYQKYKGAAEELSSLGTLGRDVFPRGTSEPVPEGPAPFAPLGVFSLLDAFERVLKRTKTKLEHQVVFDRISINDRMLELTDALRIKRRAQFDELFEGEATTFDLVITFLALLEMCKLKMLRVYQSEALSPLYLELAMTVDDEGDHNPFEAPTLDPPLPTSADDDDA
jgi:segregation and condensation protein A